MSRKKIRAVVVGCGSMSNGWLNTETVKKQVDVVGFVDVNRENASHRAEAFGSRDAIVETDLARALKTATPDVLFDCTTPNAHCEVSLIGFRHGCHVLNEKPMAENINQAKRMIRAMKKAKVSGAVIQNRRYHEPIRALRRFLETEKLGRITTVQSDFFIGTHFEGFRKEMEHVLLLDMAIHTFDAARLVAGSDAETVYCHEWNPSASHYTHGASATAIFQMTNGIVYTYNGSWCSKGLNTSWEASWRIICEKGTVLWDGGDTIVAEKVVPRKIAGYKKEEVNIPRRIAAKVEGGHNGVIGAFIDSVRNNTTPETHYTDNIKSLAMVEGAVKSAEQGRRIRIASTEVQL